MSSNYIHANAFKLIGRGVFGVKKRRDITSAGVVELVKESVMKDVGCRSERSGVPLKVGHGGTLDSSATGVLAIGTCLGCKLLPKLLHGKKTYKVTGKLGTATNTYNDKGLVTHEAESGHVTEEMIQSVLAMFKGRIMQTPPVYSALKRGGRRLSDIASTGKFVEVSARPVDCHSIVFNSFSPPYFTLNVTCGGGFYVRSLVHDIGIALGTYAHISELIRTKQGPFRLQDCLEIDQLNFKNIANCIEKIKQRYYHFFQSK